VDVKAAELEVAAADVLRLVEEELEAGVLLEACLVDDEELDAEDVLVVVLEEELVVESVTQAGSEVAFRKTVDTRLIFVGVIGKFCKGVRFKLMFCLQAASIPAPATVRTVDAALMTSPMVRSQGAALSPESAAFLIAKAV
jgi:hypothetical protein